MPRYYLHQRKGIFYAELVNNEGKRLTAKSTGKTTKDAALLVVAKWLDEGFSKKGIKKSVETVMGLSEILKAIKKNDLDENDAMKIVETLRKKELINFTVTKKGSGSKLFIDFLTEFWDWKSSPYVKEKLAHGKTIHKQHVYENERRVRIFYTKFFEGRTLESITWKDLKAFSIFLSEKREKPEGYQGIFAEYLSAGYKNKIILCGKTALKWAYENEIIETNPAARKINFSGKTKKRRVLTPKEAEIVFNEKNWKDKRCYIACLLAVTTGMRSGEVLALRKSDIDLNKDSFICRSSYNAIDGLKGTKTDEERIIPLLPEVKAMLLELLEANPHKDNPDPFIFFGLLADKPLDRKVLLISLKTACGTAKIEPCVFHSLRHYYAARLSDVRSSDQIMRVTGHSSKDVFDDYADHVIEENVDDMRDAAAGVFAKIIPFKKAV